MTLPLVIDSTEAPVIEEALQLIAGKAVVNSINIEDGEERINGRSFRSAGNTARR